MMDRGGQSLPTPTAALGQAGDPKGSSTNDLTNHLELVADGMVHVPEAAKFLGIGKSLLYLMMDRGEVPYAKIHGRRCIPRRALHEFAARQLVRRQGEGK